MSNKIKIDKIRINQRKRDIDFGKVSELAESISLIGLMNPVTVNQNHELISGLHRIEAHRLLGHKKIEVKVINVDNLLCEMAEIDENIIRNELNDIEFGEHLIRKEEILEEMGVRAKGGDNQFTMRGPAIIAGPLKTTKDIAQNIGISESSVRLKKRIARDIISEVRQQLKKTSYANNTTGLIALSREDDKIQKKVLRLLLNNGHRDIRDAIIEVKKENKRNTLIGRLKQIKKPQYDGLVLKHGDFRKVGKEIKDNSVDMIFTDPPYITEDSIDLYRSLSIMGKRVLKEGGSCLCYVTQSALPDVLKVMCPNLKYWWIISLKHGGHTGRHGRGIFVEWKPILWFIKGKSRFHIDYVADFVKSDPPEKLFHPWAQSTREAEYYINYLTPENGVVLDPMLGSGTTGVSALKLGRDFIGIEKDIDTFDIAKRRIWKSIRENKDKQ